MSTPIFPIADDELEFRYVRASGPGGQNVNKVSTAVELRFDIASSRSLPEDVKARLCRLGGKRVTDAGILIIDARRFRTQEANRRDARARLAQLLLAAAKKPKVRVATQPTRGSKKRRLARKRVRAEVKRLRGRVSDSD